MTSLEFDLHPLGPEVASYGYLYPYEEAATVLRAFTDAAPGFPESVTPELLLMTVPPMPELPEELHGQRVVLASGIHAGPPDEAGELLAPLGELGTPLGDMNAIAQYAELQSSFDAIVPDGARYYMKSHFMDTISNEAIEALLTSDAESHEGVDMFVVLRTMGGSISRVSSDESAFAHRSANFNLSIDTKWTEPAHDADGIAWARSMWDVTQPFSTGGVYVNFGGLSDEAADVRPAVLGASEQRQGEIRRAYDPDGLFEGAAHRQ